MGDLAREDAFSEPNVRELVMKYVIIVLVLLLIPAINMSGITQSRMRKRMAEIGVRKAFGATRSELLTQVLYENLLQTLLGGVLGLFFSYASVLLLSDWLLDTCAPSHTGSPQGTKGRPRPAASRKEARIISRRRSGSGRMVFIC